MRYFRILTVLSLIFTFLSCKEEAHPEYEQFLIRIDSVKVPESIVTNKPFDIEFYGTVGTNGCYKFREFKTEKTESEIFVETWGQVNKSTGICPEVMVLLQGKKLNCTIERSGNYTLKVRQPDGSYLKKNIHVD